MERNNISLAN